MIRNIVFGISLVALTSASAFASPAKHHVAKSLTVADATAPAGDTAAPAGDKTDKKAKMAKKAKKEQPKAAGAKEIKAPAPVDTAAPAHATK